MTKTPCAVCKSACYRKKLNQDGICRGCESAYCHALSKKINRTHGAIHLAFIQLYESKLKPQT